MQVLIASAPGEIDALYEWLRSDGDIVKSASVKARESSDSASMGALEVVDVALTHVTGIGSLALALAAFWQSRSRPESIRITRSDGAVLVLNSGQETDSELIAQFLAANGEPSNTS